MAVLMPLTCMRPAPECAPRVATGPHSSLSKEEIRQKILANPLSYTRIVHPRAVSGNGENAFLRAAENLRQWVRDGVMIDDREPAFYLYRLEKDGHSQTGIVGRTPIDQVISGKIHAHETIRESKLRDLASHIEECGAQIGGPILMACRGREDISGWIRRQQKGRKPMYHFRSENGVWNTIWQLKEPKTLRAVESIMRKAGDLYIADGHHRVMASVEICRRHRKEKPDYTGREPWNYLACVCFPDNELKILPYARVVNAVKGMTEKQMLEQISRCFAVEPCGREAEPEKRGEFVLCTGSSRYRMTLDERWRPREAPDCLDVAVLQKLVLAPVFGIVNPRSDSRLEFIGGTGQREKMEERCRRRDTVGFLLSPVSMEELFQVADANATMPPKSTWFEPKLCNGLFIYRLREED